MECPIRKQEMKTVRSDASYNANDNNKEYARTLFQCSSDDVWLTTEIPVEHAND